MQISNAPKVKATASLLPDFLAMMAVRASPKSNPDHKTKDGARGLLGQLIGKTEDGAMLEIVSVETIEPEPGVTLGDDREQVGGIETAGSTEQVRDTGFEKTPNCAPTDSVSLTGCPARTEAVDCAMLNEKSLTVICTVLVGREDFAPPLLTVKVSVFTPRGHIRLGLEPLAVPQPPDQLKVTGQLLGSVPLPFRVAVVPVGPAPFNV
jgi:hypothetical protein